MPQKYILKSHFKGENKLAIDYANDLNQEQLPIVTAQGGPALVIAGAGSGKTRTITYRVAYLVESGVPLDRILLVTFTNKAAKEMLSRVELLLKQDVKGIWGGTFHHIGNIMLRKHAKLIGYQPNYSILDRSDSKELIDACIVEAKIDVKEQRFPKGETLQAIFGLAVNKEKKLDNIINYYYSQFEPLAEKIIGIFELYQKRKKKNNLMDFDDLLYYWCKLLENNPDITKKYANQFLHVLVDEYQDTNMLQAKIVNLLASVHRNIMVVGDDSQSIYSFRGAHFKNIIQFPKVYPDAKQFKLEINHRSVPEILNLANASIANAKEKLPKKLRAKRSEGQKPIVAALGNVHSQAEFVAQRMLELREQGCPLNEMAVLYRAHYQSMEIQMELTKRGIPFEIRSGLRFFEEAHIKDALAYLKIFHNPRDEVSWNRVLKIIDRIGPRTAEKVFQYLSQCANPIEEISANKVIEFIPKTGEKAFKDFQSLIKRLNGQTKIPGEMIKIIINSNYEEFLKEHYLNYQERMEDLEQLGSYALQFKNLEEFLSSLALVSGIEAETITDSGEKEDEACVLSTIHQAKGLEWKVVFLVWLADGRFPSYLSFNKDEELEEERRLFYVAVTRAKDELYLTYPIIYSGYDGQVLMKTSRYLEELPQDLLEQWEVTAEDEIDLSGYKVIQLDDL